MKIAVISTTVFPCPPKGYAGLEMIAWQCAQGFAKLGHQVLLVAPKGSQGGPNITLHETTVGESEKQAYSGYWQRLLTDADVVVDHSWQKWSYILKAEGRLKAPILGVCHAPIHTMYNSPPPVPKPCLIAISKDQANGISQHLGVPARVCYNGVDLDFYKPSGPIGSSQRNDRYLFLARMSTVKSPHIAIDIANKTRVGLDLVGDDTITGEPAYVQRIRESAVNNIVYIGPQTREQCVEWFNRNKCLLHTAKFFREPFGLAPVEAAACGMPCISFGNGAMRETIKDGETGFVVDDEAQFVDLIKRDAVSLLKPKRIRDWASQFSVENSIKQYMLAIEEALAGGW